MKTSARFNYPVTFKMGTFIPRDMAVENLIEELSRSSSEFVPYFSFRECKNSDAFLATCETEHEDAVAEFLENSTDCFPLKRTYGKAVDQHVFISTEFTKD